MAPPRPVLLDDALGSLAFLADRTPETTDEQAGDAFAHVADYRDGGVFVAHWAGRSEWERHPVGDEIVMVLDGETTLFLLAADGEHGHTMTAGQFLVVPQGTWHRFETPDAVKVMSVTPQPTDHRAERPTSP
jgi:quercetin dioxygenase-like cupin family protein